MTLRTASDAVRIRDAVKRGVSCVCIGGGVLGIETAAALARQGADVTMLESHAWLMPRQLNERAGAVLEKHLEAMGVKVLKRARTASIEGDGDVAGVILEDGRKLPAGLVILATGVRPNTALARKAGLEVNSGIVVNNHMQTSDPLIYAAGDAAEHNGQLYGSWAASQYQGSIAALNAAGVETAFGGLPRASTIKAVGMDIFSVGKFMPEDGSYAVVDADGEGTYTCFVLHDGRLCGAIIMGDPALATRVKKAVEDGVAVPEDCRSVTALCNWLRG
jgi:nitrite reductase (NADH) large subunit